ncbi:MAG: sortase, partial [Rubrobacteraceae bacterium]
FDLNKLQNGDKVYVTDANDTRYTYEVFEETVVSPSDLSVTEPIPGKNVITLQTCTLPDYSDRLVVQAELTDVA